MMIYFAANRIHNFVHGKTGDFEMMFSVPRPRSREGARVIAGFTSNSRHFVSLPLAGNYTASLSIETPSPIIPSHKSEIKSNMGRIGDGDVHAAYVEFRAKESDKVPTQTPPPYHRQLFPFPSSSPAVKRRSVTLILVHTVPLSTMHLLPISPCQKHVPPTPAPP